VFLMAVLLVFFCLWFCFWILPAVVWERGRRIERRRAQASAHMSRAERALAEERAGTLLRDLLDETEYQQLMQHGYLDVPSPGHAGRLYRIPGCPGRICVIEHGRAVMELCIRPISPLPASDVVAVHKLMIEGAEEEYLAHANELPLTLMTQLLGR
jgi:hypothetical protein